MNLKLVCGHTIAELPKKSGCVLDIGGHKLGFAGPMAIDGYKVFVIEPDKDTPLPKDPNIHLIRTALVSQGRAGQVCNLVKWSSGEGNHLDCLPGGVPESSSMQLTTTMSIAQIHNMFKVDVWDIVKMDCEGAEYDALLEWPGPIARQITIEFHEHTGGHRDGKSVYPAILNHLGQWYDAVQHVAEVRYYCKKPNYWDSLFVLKEEVS